MPLRLDILEAKTGICLFEKIWKWSGISQATAICKLILTFYQLSREVGDTGDVSQAIFSMSSASISGYSPATNVGGLSMKRGDKGSGSKQAAYIPTSLKKKHAKDDSHSSIRLACAKNKRVIVAVFHETEGEFPAMKQFAEEVLKAFASRFGKKLKEMKDKFTTINEDDQNAMKEILDIFSGFLEEAESLRVNYEPNLKSLGTPPPLPQSQQSSEHTLAIPQLVGREDPEGSQRTSMNNDNTPDKTPLATSSSSEMVLS